MSHSSAFARLSDPQASLWSSDSDDNLSHSSQRPVALPNILEGFGPRPRLSSPPLFPRDFYTLPAPNAAVGAQSFARPFRDTLNDINRALESANTAIQDIQEAFVIPEVVNSRESRVMPPLVDLTTASSRHSPEQQRQQPGHTARRRSRIMTLLNDLPPEYDLNTQPIPLDRFGANRLPRLRGGFPDYDTDRPTEPMQRRHRIENQIQRHTVGEPFALFPGRPARLDPQQWEQQAIQRQREARERWDLNQGRREALTSQRSRSRSPRRSSPPIRQRSESEVRPESSGPRAKSESPVESIDLTTVDKKTSASDILAKQLEEAVASQRVSSEAGYTRLTAYKCPICMETPKDLTATICGHLFCHRCILDSLKWSEEHRGEGMPHTRPRGVCPVCRKEMRRVDTDEKGRTLVPLNIMLSKQKRKQTWEDVKGKGVARSVPKQDGKMRESTSELMGRFVNLDGT